MIELYVLLAAMLVAALAAIQIKDLLAAAVALGIVGFSVAIMFILLQAPDLAIVQIVVETLTVVFFAAVILRTTNTDTTIAGGLKRALSDRGSRGQLVFPAVVYGVFCVVFLAVVGRALAELPSFGSPTMLVAREYIALGLEKTGAANVVAAIILDFRGYDTLGEATVMFTAVVGVLTIMRRAGRKER
jgi:multisubunit Na+/H+ antiporter MnhB subunit